MTDFGRKQGDMRRSVYDPNKDGVLAVAQTEADMTKAVYDPTIATIIALLGNHNAEHESGGDDEIDCSGLAGIAGAGLEGDGTVGRVFRLARLFIKNGTNADTLKCQLVDRWNGDVIAETDNIAKNATTGHFTYSSDGYYLTIEVAGLIANVLVVFATVYLNWCTIDLTCDAYPSGNGILVSLFNTTAGSVRNIENLVDAGSIYLNLLYITDA